MRKALILISLLATLALAVTASAALASGGRSPAPSASADDHGRHAEPGDDRGHGRRHHGHEHAASHR